MQLSILAKEKFMTCSKSIICVWIPGRGCYLPCVEYIKSPYLLQPFEDVAI